MLLFPYHNAWADSTPKNGVKVPTTLKKSVQQTNQKPTNQKQTNQKDTDQQQAHTYEKKINDLLINTSVRADVSVLPASRFAVRLTGSTSDTQQKQDIVAFVQSISASLVISSFGVTVSPRPAGGPPQGRIDQALAAYKAAIDQKTSGTTASGSLLPNLDGTYLMVLNGKLPAKDKDALKDYAESLATIMLPDLVRVVQKIDVVDGSKKLTSITRVWPLMFLRGSLPAGADPTQTGDIEPRGKDVAATDLATFLTQLYDNSANKVSVQANENRLVLAGDPTEVLHLRQMLALALDVPSSQVRADVVVIQVNSSNKQPGSREQALRKMDEIRAGIQLVRDLSKIARYRLDAYIQNNAGSHVPDTTQGLLKKVGFNPDPKRPLALAETLLFAGFLREDLRADLTGKGKLAEDFTQLLDDATALLKKPHVVIPSQEDRSTANPVLEQWSQAPTVRQHSDHLLRLVGAIRQHAMRLGKANKPLLPRLMERLSTSSVGADKQGLETFLQKWIDCRLSFMKGEDYDISREMVPDALNSASAATDRALKQSMDAFTVDMHDLLIDPLIQWIRDDVQLGSAKDSGIDIVGGASIVVRNRTLATVSGSAESYFPFTQIPKLTQNSLTEALKLSNGDTSNKSVQQTVARNPDGSIVRDANGNPVILNNGEELVRDTNGKALLTNNAPTTFKTTPANLPLTVLGVLNPLQALLVQSVFAEDNATVTFNRVAPGINLSLRPFVLPDGGSARVQLKLTTNVVVDPTTNQIAAGGRPLDRIVSQSTTTEATVDAYELMELTTFGVQTTAPGDYSWRIPLLDQLPLVGKLFTGPRSRETHRQESIALITLSIQPRSMDLVPYLNYPEISKNESKQISK